MLYAELSSCCSAIARLQARVCYCQQPAACHVPGEQRRGLLLPSSQCLDHCMTTVLLLPFIARLWCSSTMLLPLTLLVAAAAAGCCRGP